VLISQNYVQRYISGKKTVNLDLWLFSARYQLLELEAYCRSNDEVLEELVKILHDPERGLVYMVQTQGIPLSVVTKLIAELVVPRKRITHCPYCSNDHEC
jgi:hypothetical protein